MTSAFVTLALGGVLVGFTSSTAQAQELTASRVDPVPVPIQPPTQINPEPVPWPVCHTVEVTPGNPLFLSGTGRLTATGSGETHFKIRNGSVAYQGSGIVAVKASTNDTVTVSGSGHKLKIGKWVLYWGYGQLKVSGDHFKTVSYGKFRVTAQGTGSVLIKGHWQVRYCRLLIAEAEAIPLPKVIPAFLKRAVD